MNAEEKITNPSETVLSVVLVVGEKRRNAVYALQSILQQSLINRIEVLVVDCGDADITPLPGSDHPSVRVLHVLQQVSFGEARAQAVQQARSPIVAFLEEHCTAFPGWAEALVSAHAGPWAGVGGEVYNATAGKGISDAIYLMGYIHWTPPAKRGEDPLLASHNSSYKRKVLLSYGDSLPILLISEPVLQWKMCADGHRLFVEPEVKFMHINESKLSSLRGYFWWNCCFGYTRSKVFGWSKLKRTAYCVYSPVAPWLRVARMFVYIMRNKSERLWAFLCNMPLILAIQYYCTLGQVIGIIFGPGEAETHFTEHELNGGGPLR